MPLPHPIRAVTQKLIRQAGQLGARTMRPTDLATQALVEAVARWETSTLALLTVLSESGGTDQGPSTLSLAQEAADAAADVRALWPRRRLPPVARPTVVVELLHLLRHDLARHADRLADLSNARSAVTPATNVEVAQLRRLLEKVVREVLDDPVGPAPARRPQGRRGSPCPRQPRGR